MTFIVKVVGEMLEDPTLLEKLWRLPACMLVERRALEVCRGRRGRVCCWKNLMKKTLLCMEKSCEAMLQLKGRSVVDHLTWRSVHQEEGEFVAAEIIQWRESLQFDGPLFCVCIGRPISEGCNSVESLRVDSLHKWRGLEETEPARVCPVVGCCCGWRVVNFFF